MFNLQGSELVIILLLALVVLGPEKLPDAMRKAGQFYAELKKMSSGFQDEFKSALDEPMREMRETANLIRDSADFRKLQDGERTEKPHSAEMVSAADTDAVPTDDLPFQEPGAVDAQTDATGDPGDVPDDVPDDDGSADDPPPLPDEFDVTPGAEPASDLGADEFEAPSDERDDPGSTG